MSDGKVVRVERPIRVVDYRAPADDAAPLTIVKVIGGTLLAFGALATVTVAFVIATVTFVSMKNGDSTNVIGFGGLTVFLAAVAWQLALKAVLEFRRHRPWTFKGVDLSKRAHLDPMFAYWTVWVVGVVARRSYSRSDDPDTPTANGWMMTFFLLGMVVAVRITIRFRRKRPEIPVAAARNLRSNSIWENWQ